MKFDKLFALLVESAVKEQPKRKMNAAAALHKWFIARSYGKLTPEKEAKYEKLIASSAPTSVAHAVHHLGKRFELGEKEILNSSSNNIIKYGMFLLKRVFKIDPKELPNLKMMDKDQQATFFRSLIEAPTQHDVERIIQTAKV